LLQTKGPRPHPAKGVTQEEFRDIMRGFIAAANAVAARPEWREKTGGLGGPLYSFDGASAHWSVEALEELGVTVDLLLPLPAKSPDMHKVIEHVFGRMKPKLRDWLYHHPAKRTLEEYMAQVVRLFWENAEVAGQETIDGDVASLHATYEKVVECRGGEIPKQYR
jgi:hypothetical protein